LSPLYVYKIADIWCAQQI